MKTAARLVRLNDNGDNTTLDARNLERVCETYEDDYEKGQRVYVFRDGSKIITKEYPYPIVIKSK
jgi:hypothetical protein